MATTAHVKLRVREGAAYKRLVRADFNGKKYVVRVGFMGGAFHESGPTNAYIAAILEFGYEEGNIKPRPAFGPSWDLNLPKYRALCRRIAEGVLDGRVTPEQGLGLLGEQMVADLRNFIVGGEPIAPENAPSVRARKERKRLNSQWGIRTWVDTGALVDAITYVVEEV